MARERFETLDGMRGVAAILVMIGHYNLQSPLLFLHNTFIAVDFFFILSGFVIMHAYGSRLAGGMAPAVYMWHRVIRLFPMMAIGVLLGVPGFLLYSRLGHTDYLPREVIASVASNLCFLPYLNDKTILNPTGPATGVLFPVNGALWSVFFEVVASAAFLLLYRQSERTLLKLCLGALALVLASSAFFAFFLYSPKLIVGLGWGTQNFLGGFPRVFYGFTCGMLIYRARARLGRRFFGAAHVSSTAGALLLYAALAGVLLFPLVDPGFYYLLALAVLAPLLVIWGGEVNPANRVLVKFSQCLGWISYPLYCVHRPVFILVQALDEKFGLAGHIVGSPALLALGASLLLAMAFGYCIDAPVRNWLRQRIDQSHPSVYSQPAAHGSALGFREDN